MLAVEDNASRRIFDMIERDSSSVTQNVELLNSVRESLNRLIPILEVITDHGSEFVNAHTDDRLCLDHASKR